MFTLTDKMDQTCLQVSSRALRRGYMCFFNCESESTNSLWLKMVENKAEEGTLLMHRSDRLKGNSCHNALGLSKESFSFRQQKHLVRFRKTSCFVLNYLFLSPRMRSVMARSLKVDVKNICSFLPLMWLEIVVTAL